MSLMAAMLPDAAPQDAFERVRGLPFVELSSDGLVMHDTVREVVAAYLRAPTLTGRGAIASPPGVSCATRSPAPPRTRCGDIPRTSCSSSRTRPSARRSSRRPSTLLRRPARDEDWPAIREIAAASEPPDRWPSSRSGGGAAGRVLDGPRRVGRVVGFSVAIQRRRVPRALFDADPLARIFRDHVRRLPVPRGQRVLFLRFQFAHPEDPNQALVIAALILDIKRMYMELRPELRRVYNVLPEQYGPASPWTRLGFRAVLDAPVRFDGVAYYAHVLDFGPASVDGWLTRIIATELQVNEDSILDVAQHQLVLDDRRVALTKLEFEVFKYLFERPGDVVERASLLRDVWGYDYAGGSNVIEALVKSLRRKLGDRAAAIETVRGVGYRFASPPDENCAVDAERGAGLLSSERVIARRPTADSLPPDVRPPRSIPRPRGPHRRAGDHAQRGRPDPRPRLRRGRLRDPGRHRGRRRGLTGRAHGGGVSGSLTSRRASRTIRTNSRRWAIGRMCDGSPA